MRFVDIRGVNPIDWILSVWKYRMARSDRFFVVLCCGIRRKSDWLLIFARMQSKIHDERGEMCCPTWVESVL